jgi:hypothetical protein
MSVHGGSNIITDGLIFAIDAGNSKCFTSGNTSCVNMVTQGAVTGASGTPGTGTHTPDTTAFPAYSSEAGGVFDFNFAGGRGMNVEEDLGSHSAITLEMWFYKTSATVQYFIDARNDGGTWFLSNYTSDNINFEDQLTYNFDATYNASSTNFLNQWIHMIVTSESTGGKIYLNGAEVTPLVSNSVNENLGVNFRIGTRYTDSSRWTGKMGPILIYNKVLTAAEVKQNFEAQKGRFNL